MKSQTFWIKWLVAVLAFATVKAIAQEPATSASSPSKALESWEQKLLGKYQKLISPVLSDHTFGCIDCHSSQTMSNLVLTGNELQDFRHMLDNGYFSSFGPDSILGRIISSNPDRRMPKDAPAWDAGKTRKLKKFLRIVDHESEHLGTAPDERFPRSLLSPFEGESALRQPAQFLTYRQLRARIKSVFDDDWVRGSEDRFKIHLSAFGGADFQTRFNESTTPTPAYLIALEPLARDVSSLAIRQKTGPFRDFPDMLLSDVPSPEMAKHESEMVQVLYREILGRAATDKELQSSLQLLSQVRSFEDAIGVRDSKLQFELIASDSEQKRTSVQSIAIPISGSRQVIQQTLIDQTKNTVPETKIDEVLGLLFSPMTMSLSNQDDSISLAEGFEEVLVGRVQIGPDQEASFKLHNSGTFRNVTFGGLRLVDNSRQGQLIKVDDASVSLQGAWEFKQANGFSYVEDGNQNKGDSQINVQFASSESAEFDVYCIYYRDQANSTSVLSELFSDGLGVQANRLANSANARPEKPGTAKFHYDCGNDSIPFFELPSAYQFSESGYIEISNAGTFSRVTAGALELINIDNPDNHFLLDSAEAEGSEQWKSYSEGNFGAYNVRGKKLHDENDHKGKRHLRYRLAGRQKDGWKPNSFYRIHVYYPGKRDHEPLVPVSVKAQKSLPIIQVASPRSGKSDAILTLDATESFNLQNSQLVFQWRQVAGPRVDVDNWHSPRITFRVPRQNPKEMSWIALSSALIRHPDFLFTGAVSAAAEQSTSSDRLHLNKLALDLLGRPPSPSELSAFDNGKRVDELVDEYLTSSEFRDFYFHRIRLYLESQGTSSQDEPARLWSFVAFNDRPFQEILTADYTVDEAFNRVSRPAEHGRTGVLTTKGFIEGKPGLPHYNYAAQVTMLFLGYVYEVPPEIVEQREGVTALGTTDPNSNCYSCHKILTPLAFQRSNWNDLGEYRAKDEDGAVIDASDRGVVAEYPFKGKGLEAFALQAVKKERYIRTIINTHVRFYFGRPLRYREDERSLYKHLWDVAHDSNFSLRAVIRAIVLSPEYAGLSKAEKLLANAP